MLLEGFIRRTLAYLGGGSEGLSLDEYGAALVSQLLPKYTKLAAGGMLYIVDTHAGTAKAPVVAPPTTSPEWAIYNYSNEETLIVLKAALTLKSGTAGLGLALMGAVAVGNQTAVTGDYASTIKTCLDGSDKKPACWVTNNPTLINTPAWFPFAGTQVNSVATDSVGDSLIGDPEGALQAKPNGGMVAFEALGETGATALFTFAALIAMVRLNRG